jgi:hypothetical protein
LIHKTVDAVAVGLNPTDLDLTPSGDSAVVVSRGSEELWVLNTGDPFAPATVYPLPSGLSLGSVLFDPGGLRAVLYTTASLVDHYAIWNLVADGITEHGLEKPVAGMAISPTGDSLLVFHTEDDAPDADPAGPFYGEFALTLINLDDSRSNPLLLPAKPNGYALSHSGEVGYFTMEGEQFLERLDFATLLHEQIELKSDPVYIGVLPDLDIDDGLEPVAWVSQDHDLGRISFYDDNDASLETITGFELNAGVE